MGFSFSLKNANAVGYLIDGNIVTFLEESARSNEMLQPNLEFLDQIIRNTERHFFTSKRFWRKMFPNLDRLRVEWETVRKDFYNLRRQDEADYSFINNNRRLLNFLTSLSELLVKCRIKTLLLPGFQKNEINRFMYEPYLLHDLVMRHPDDDILILQIKESLQERDTAILNSFPKFETAYNQIDEWPGVLLWNDEESLFLKVNNQRELYDIYEILRFEKGSFNFLKQHFGNKESHKKYAYFFHISDLHFGNTESNRRKSRLTKILETHLNKLNDKSTAIPIITGDLIDSPNLTNKNTYLDFCESLKDKGFEKPIQILGNHDVDTSGFIKRLTTQKSVITHLAGANNVELLRDLNLGFIKFNSNTGGNLAQGAIGQDQLMNLGNEIDSISDNEKLNFIALLHHHPKEIENPDWYKRDWYEALLGNNNFEKTMKLVDSDLFLDWIERRGIKLVLHGHKHIPNIHLHKDIAIIASGSSTGKVRHKEEGKTYLTYNLIKYSVDDKRPVSCSIIAEENLGSGTKNMLLHLL